MSIYDIEWNRDSDTHMEHRIEEISHVRDLAEWEKDLVKSQFTQSDFNQYDNTPEE